MRASVLKALNAARRERRAAVLVTSIPQGAEALVIGGQVVAGDLDLSPEIFDQARAAIDADQSRHDPDRALFFQVFMPSPRLIVIGAVHIAQALVPMAQLCGYEVTVVDPRRAWASAARFPGIALTHAWPDEAMTALKPDRRTAVVALTHDPKLDDPALSIALKSEAAYIGALGSKTTHAKRRQRLKDQGFSDAELERIDGPIGLAIGAKSPAEIALSILGKITQVRRGALKLVPA